MQKHNQTEADLMAIVQKPFNQSIFGEKFGMKILNNSFYDRTILWTTLGRILVFIHHSVIRRARLPA